VGPVILFDKSFLEMLSVDEAAIFDFMFQSNICPIFYIETLAAALNDFYARYADDPLIVDKWLTLQATVPEPATLDRVKALTNHPAFSFTNPNRVRALIHAFALANHKEFNRADGAGYDFIVDTVLTLYPKNPQVAARLLSALKSWRVLEPARRARAQAALRRVAAAPSLSPDVGDIVQRALQENQ
jgi:aminopeptidase N